MRTTSEQCMCLAFRQGRQLSKPRMGLVVQCKLQGWPYIVHQPAKQRFAHKHAAGSYPVHCSHAAAVPAGAKAHTGAFEHSNIDSLHQQHVNGRGPGAFPLPVHPKQLAQYPPMLGWDRCSTLMLNCDQDKKKPTSPPWLCTRASRTFLLWSPWSRKNMMQPCKAWDCCSTELRSVRTYSSMVVTLAFLGLVRPLLVCSLPAQDHCAG